MTIIKSQKKKNKKTRKSSLKYDNTQNQDQEKSGEIDYAKIQIFSHLRTFKDTSTKYYGINSAYSSNDPRKL